MRELWYVQGLLGYYWMVQSKDPEEMIGKRYEEYINRHAEDYINDVKKIITSGKINKIPKKDQKTMLLYKTGKNGESGQTYNMMRIARTEANRMQNEAALEAYHTAGIKRYRFHASLDEKTCLDCWKLDGMSFSVDAGLEGENLPPIHPNCRCYITPIIDNGTEFKNITNTRKIEYNKWKERYVHTDVDKLFL